MDQKTTEGESNVADDSVIVVPLQTKDHFASLTRNKPQIH